MVGWALNTNHWQAHLSPLLQHAAIVHSDRFINTYTKLVCLLVSLFLCISDVSL